MFIPFKNLFNTLIPYWNTAQLFKVQCKAKLRQLEEFIENTINKAEVKTAFLERKSGYKRQPKNAKSLKNQKTEKRESASLPKRFTFSPLRQKAVNKLLKGTGVKVKPEDEVFPEDFLKLKKCNNPQ